MRMMLPSQKKHRTTPDRNFNGYMRVSKNIISLIMVLIISTNATYAQVRSGLSISLLTCSQGDELYSTFGHTAIRVIDSVSLTDIVFNYGTFEFDDPSFYSKFVRGKLNYFLSAEQFNDFKAVYEYEKRGIIEQELVLTDQEKMSIRDKLYNNIKEENKFYKYDFLFDNCTTRVRDIIFNTKKYNTTIPFVTPESFTFRNAIHEYLDKGNKHWSKLGIDILLGSPTDQKMNAYQGLFLPDNLMKALDSCSKQSQQYTVSSRTILKGNSTPAQNTRFIPLFIFTVIFGGCALLLFAKNSILKKTSNIISRSFLFITALLGVLLIFMWAGTDHAMCKYNYNLLWALPTNIILAFANRQSKVFRILSPITVMVLVVLLSTWLILPQQLNIALIPLILYLTLALIKISRS